MPDHKIVTQTEWLDARRALLEREKAFTKERDALTRARQELPWVRIETDYVFDGPDGKEALSDLFDGRSQLIIYHFMYGADWDEGCPSCSFWADGYDRIAVHLNARDVSLAAISTASLENLRPIRNDLAGHLNGCRQRAIVSIKIFMSAFRKRSLRKTRRTTISVPSALMDPRRPA